MNRTSKCVWNWIVEIIERALNRGINRQNRRKNPEAQIARKMSAACIDNETQVRSSKQENRGKAPHLPKRLLPTTMAVLLAFLNGVILQAVKQFANGVSRLLFVIRF